jgi:hypothetical protein
LLKDVDADERVSSEETLEATLKGFNDGYNDICGRNVENDATTFRVQTSVARRNNDIMVPQKT